MDFNPYFQDGYNKEEDRRLKSRAEKARVYREYVQAKTDAGEEVDPYEMDRLRMSMAGNDPYGASMIPAGAALDNLVQRANERSTLSRMKIGNEMNAQRETENKFVQSIVDDNWDKTPEEFAKTFTDTFGEQDGTIIYGRFKDQLPNMLNESTAKQYATLSSSPAAKFLYEEADIDRLFPAQARKPAMRKVLMSIMKDNQRGRAKEDFTQTNEALQNMPTFVPNSPQAQKWWEGAVGGTLNDPASFGTVVAPAAYTQYRSAQDAKLAELASKDALFLNAARSGDQLSIFEATKNLMVKAGLPAPASDQDPNYIRVKQILDLVGRSDAITTYDKREGDLKSSAITEADALAKTAKARVEAAQSAYFDPETYGDGESIDERITAAINLIQTDPSFFPSQENIMGMTAFVKAAYDADKSNFNPTTVAGQFTAEGGAESKVDWIDRRTTQALESEYQIKPGTNFNQWSDTRTTKLNEAMADTFQKLSKPAATQQEYNLKVEAKANRVMLLKREINNIRQVINTLNNDPAKRANIAGYDYAKSVQTLQTLESSLKAIEDFVVVPPAVQQGASAEQLDESHQARAGSMREWGQNMDRRMGLSSATPVNYSAPTAHEGVIPVAFQPTTAPTRMDTYLDSIADAESNGNPFARAATSSARGLFQFTKGTWNALVTKYGERYGITGDDIYNPNAQRIMASLLTQENAAQLVNQTGKLPDEGDLYLAHFLGPSRAAVVINQQGSSMLAANLFPDAAAANRSIFYKDGVPVTIEQLYKTMSGKVKSRIKKTRSEIEI